MFGKKGDKKGEKQDSPEPVYIGDSIIIPKSPKVGKQGTTLVQNPLYAQKKVDLRKAIHQQNEELGDKTVVVSERPRRGTIDSSDVIRSLLKVFLYILNTKIFMSI
jgi:hypothetical protein